MNREYITHKGLIQWFLDQQTESQLQTIGQSLQALKLSRVHADYRPNHFIQSKAVHDIGEAQKIIAAINTLLNNVTLTE